MISRYGNSTLARLLIVVYLLGIGTVSGQIREKIEPDFLPVDEAYRLSTELTDEGLIVATFDIEEGYYLYRHSLSFEAGPGIELGETAIPDGKKHYDEFFGDVEVYYHELQMSVPLLQQSEQLRVGIHFQGCADYGLCYPPEVRWIEFDDGFSVVSSAASVDGASLSLVWILSSALLAGLILNLMPCVFPVLSIKAVAILQHPTEFRSISHALGYSVGIIVTFLMLGVIATLLRETGNLVGWGFQLQSAGFVIAMALLLLLMSFNFFGLIEIPGFSVEGSSKNSVFTGFLTVLLATPCTVPFMATAIGFGLTQGVLSLISVMVAMGGGLALPYVLITSIPVIAKLLPKPGPWLGTFKKVMAYPLLLTVLWLLYVLTELQGGLGLVWFGVGAICCVAVIQIVSAKPQHFKVAWLAILLLSGGVVWGVTTVEGTPGNDSEFTLSEFDRTLSADAPMFVNVTASWCITCLANERTTLSTSSLQEYFEQRGITYQKIDWTNRNAEVTRYLGRFGRVGVPLYVYYATDGSTVVLPQLLTVPLVKSYIEEQEGSI